MMTNDGVYCIPDGHGEDGGVGLLYACRRDVASGDNLLGGGQGAFFGARTQFLDLKFCSSCSKINANLWTCKAKLSHIVGILTKLMKRFENPHSFI